MLRSGERSRVFDHTIPLQDETERQAVEASEDIFAWLASSGRTQERASLLRRVVFPALVSDFLQFVYQALACSGQGHLAVTYALLRKPLQESLHLVELIVTDVDNFAMKLAEEPHKLAQGSTGGLEAHRKRVAAAIAKINGADLFDASYLVALRYDKTYENGFGRLFDPAIHLFTGQDAIRTEPLNINFIFSGPEEKWLQQAFLYSRLPYILTYARLLFESFLSNFIKTDPRYLEDIERRAAAVTLLWCETVHEDYLDEHVSRFVDVTRARLLSQCQAKGYRVPTQNDLVRMRHTGSWPGESRLAVSARNLRYSANDLAARTLRRGTELAEQLTEKNSRRKSRRFGTND